MKRLAAVLVIAASVALSACDASHGGSFAPDARQTLTTPQALPGTTPQALPGTTPQALPGASLACDLTFEQDAANCSIAINVAVPPIADLSTPSNLLPGLHPSDLRDAYALPWQNAGATVAIVDAYDDPLAESDLAVYRAAYGMPPCTTSNGCFKKVNERGEQFAYPALNTGWDEEISLDVDMVSAACPYCNIVLVEADSPSFDDLGKSVDLAASLGAVAIGNSYYGPEWSGELAYDAHYDHPGIAITASAGDQASGFYPAASPFVTAVGGTTLSGSAGSWSESAWDYSGRGCSAYEAKPAWQDGKLCGNARSMNDLAAVADPQTGVSMYDSAAGGWLVAGGTSVGAPLIAAAYALSSNPQGPAYSYAHASAFRDVAPAGYDAITGLGTPVGTAGL